MSKDMMMFLLWCWSSLCAAFVSVPFGTLLQIAEHIIATCISDVS